MFKKCSKCNKELEINNFNIKGHRKDGSTKYQPYCKECNKIASREWYSNKANKQSIIDKVAEYKRVNRKLFNEFKSTLRCIKCGENHISCLDFHHKDPNTKDFSISDMRSKGMTTLKSEIEKCDVLCANCHRKLHWIENNLNTH